MVQGKNEEKCDQQDLEMIWREEAHNKINHSKKTIKYPKNNNKSDSKGWIKL